MSYANNLPVISSDTNYLSYLREVRDIASLGQEEEYLLAKRMIDHKDIQAAHKLVVSHLKLVIKVATSYKGYGLPIMDLISEGTLGLMQAVKRFDPERGYRLSTYAVFWIKAYIKEYVLKSWSLVKIGTTSAQKKLFFNFKKLKNKIISYEQRELRNEEYKQISDELNVSTSETIEMDRRFKTDFSLNNRMSDENNTEFQEMIPETRPNQEAYLSGIQEYSKRKSIFQKAMLSLEERERDIITARRLNDNPMTLEVLSKKYGISAERIRQIEVKAFEKLKLIASNS